MTLSEIVAVAVGVLLFLCVQAAKLARSTRRANR